MSDEWVWTIALTNGGQALVDICDVHLARYAWSRTRDGYVVRSSKGRTIRLHREILGLTDPKIQADHINHDKLDNRRSNLRRATHAQNMENSRSQKGSTSPYRGVHWDNRWSRWYSEVVHEGKRYHLGVCISEIDAAKRAEAFYRTHMPFAVPVAELDPVAPCDCRQCSENRVRTDNRSGHQGIHWRADRNKWVVQLSVNGKRHNLGDYPDLDQAVRVAADFRAKLAA